MIITVGKREIHLAPLCESNNIIISMKRVGYAIINQGDEVIDVIENSMVNEMIKQVKQFDNVDVILLNAK